MRIRRALSRRSPARAKLPQTWRRPRGQQRSIKPTSRASSNFFGTRERVVTCFSQGVNQSAQGTDKVNAIINVHLATGRIGRPGMGPFSLTGQPNAMGGREVGGLANQLAAHMGFSPAEQDRVRRFWNAPRMATHEGLKAVDMFEAIERGTIKALWVMATNPGRVVAARRRDARRAEEARTVRRVRERALSNDTIEAGAQVLLPAASWGEKDGTVTNSERRISRQRAFLPLPGEARPDWWIVSEVARRLGFRRAFDYSGPADVFREHAALSAFENNGERDFDIGALASLSDDRYDALDPVMWPARAGEARGERRFFAAGEFFTGDRPRPLRRAGAATAAHRDQRRLSVAAEYRALARPVAHDDADGSESASVRPFARAVHRGPSGRCEGEQSSPTAALPKSRRHTAARS